MQCCNVDGLIFILSCIIVVYCSVCFVLYASCKFTFNANLMNKSCLSLNITANCLGKCGQGNEKKPVQPGGWRNRMVWIEIQLNEKFEKMSKFLHVGSEWKGMEWNGFQLNGMLVPKCSIVQFGTEWNGFQQNTMFGDNVTWSHLVQNGMVPKNWMLVKQSNMEQFDTEWNQQNGMLVTQCYGEIWNKMECGYHNVTWSDVERNGMVWNRTVGTVRASR